MCRCCCCLPICCCFSRKSRQSFPINEKKNLDRSANALDEINKVVVRPVQTVRLATKETYKKTTSPKKTLKEKSQTKSTKSEEKFLQSRTALETLFQKVKPPPTSSSPVPISIHSVVDENKSAEPEDLQTSTASDWPSTTMSERSNEKKLPNVFSQVLGGPLARGNLVKNKSQTTRKSKLVLQNVRKMIDDQNSQTDRPSESVQL